MSLITTPFGIRTTAREVLSDVDLTGRRMIVTGGASGLGTQTVRALAGAGASVTIATRTPTDADALVKELPGTDAAALDLADLRSVRAFCDAWDGPVDAIIANAGVMMLPTRELSPQRWELHLATNYLGHFALILGLLPALRAAGKARVGVVSSGAQRLRGFDFDDPQFDRHPYNGIEAYAQSKTAEALLALGISRRWAGDGITANACEPGWIHTRLQRYVDRAAKQAMGQMDAEGNLLTPDYFKTPEQGAASATLLAASPLLDGITGRYFDEDHQEAGVAEGATMSTTRGVAAWSADPAAADRLWDYALPVVRDAV